MLKQWEVSILPKLKLSLEEVVGFSGRGWDVLKWAGEFWGFGSGLD